MPFIELDALHWDPEWTPVPTEVFLARLDESLALAPDGWVIDGNYEGKLGDRLWRGADTVVFLDLPLPALLFRVVRRTVVRSVRRAELYSGNRERLRYLVRPWRESLLYFTARFYRSKRARFDARVQDPAYAHAAFVRLRSGRAVDRWVRDVRGVPV